MLTLEDINQFEAHMKMFDNDANNANNPPKVYPAICAAARLHLAAEAAAASSTPRAVQAATKGREKKEAAA